MAAQVKYNLIDRTAERELAPACQQFGLPIVPYAPLHGGLLADLRVLERDVAGDQRFAGAGFSEAEIALARRSIDSAAPGDWRRRRRTRTRAARNAHRDCVAHRP